MTSPYLDRPLIPLAVALPRMLEKIEAERHGRDRGRGREVAPPPASRGNTPPARAERFSYPAVNRPIPN
jgi:hypothetical protein